MKRPKSPRRYRLKYISRQFNVSSSLNYRVELMVIDQTQGKRLFGQFDLTSNTIEIVGANDNWYTPRLPKYVMREVKRHILESFRAYLLNPQQEGAAVFYEYTQDARKRYDNLRYHDELFVKAYADAYQKELAK